MIGRVGRRPSMFHGGGDGRTYSGVWPGGQAARKGRFFDRYGSPTTLGDPLRRTDATESKAAWRKAWPGELPTWLYYRNYRAKSARRANRRVSPGGSRSRAVLPRANAWCRICPPRGRRSRSTIPTRCRRSCGWRFRGTPGPDAAAKWSGAAANRSASSSSVNLASIREER